MTDNYVKTFMEFGTDLFYTARLDGGFQSNILENIERGPSEDFNVHCTMKSLPLMDKFVKMFVPKQEGALLLDPFAGSGTTRLAAKNNGIDYVGIEIEEKYLDIINGRLGRVIKSSK